MKKKITTRDDFLNDIWSQVRLKLKSILSYDITTQKTYRYSITCLLLHHLDILSWSSRVVRTWIHSWSTRNVDCESTANEYDRSVVSYLLDKSPRMINNIKNLGYRSKSWNGKKKLSFSDARITRSSQNRKNTKYYRHTKHDLFIFNTFVNIKRICRFRRFRTYEKTWFIRYRKIYRWISHLNRLQICV